MITRRELAIYYSVPAVLIVAFLVLRKPDWALGVALIYVIASALSLVILWRNREAS